MLPLRSDVERRQEGDTVTLVDPLFGRAPSLPASVLEADGEAIQRALVLLHLVEGFGEAHVERIRALREGRAPFEVRALAGARFACQGSGGCCVNYVFGPLTDADVTRVTANVGEGWFQTRPDGSRFLHVSEGGSCVFLEDGTRCGLHARFGAGSKPGFCQLFPLTVWPTVAGMRVVDNGECMSWPVSSREGAPLGAQFAALQQHVPPNLALQNPTVTFPGGQADYAYFLPLQDAWVDAAGDLRRCAGLFLGWTAALSSFPVASGEPDRAIAAAMSSPSIPPGPPHALAGLAADVHTLMGALPHPPPFQTEVMGALSAIAEGATSPMDPAWAPAFAQHLYGGRALIRNRPLAALLRLRLLAAVASHTGLPVATRRLMVAWPNLEAIFTRHEARAMEILAA